MSPTINPGGFRHRLGENASKKSGVSLQSLTWEVDPLECPKCHGEMKIISFIIEKTVIRKILDHLGLWKEIKRGPPNKASPPAETIAEIKEREYEPFNDGWPVYEEPFITIQ